MVPGTLSDSIQVNKSLYMYEKYGQTSLLYFYSKSGDPLISLTSLTWAQPLGGRRVRTSPKFGRTPNFLHSFLFVFVFALFCLAVCTLYVLLCDDDDDDDDDDNNNNVIM